MKPETRAWLEKASLALNAARRNLTAEDADHAISRAYYAAFYAATAALNEVNLTTKSHKGTHKLFYREYIDTEKIDSHHNQAFSRLFQNRQVADYTFGTTFGPKAALDAIQQAEAFVEAVAALLST